MNETQSNQSEMPTPPTSTANAPTLTAKQKLRAWLELSRISNLPTVWSNVLVGVAIGAYFDSCADQWSEALACDSNVVLTSSHWVAAGWLSMAVSLLYIGGMILNDVIDAPIDATDRPDRPIPSGRIPRALALLVSIVLMVIGTTLVAVRFPASWNWLASLVVCIVAYDLIHKKTWLAVILMGLCRGLVYLLAAYSVTNEELMIFRSGASVHGVAVVMSFYVVGITFVARNETKEGIDHRRWMSLLMLALALAAAIFTRAPSTTTAWHAIILIVMFLWFGAAAWFVFKKPPRIINAVLFWLAGISLIDAHILINLEVMPFCAIAVGCFALTAWGHRHILGT